MQLETEKAKITGEPLVTFCALETHILRPVSIHATFVLQDWGSDDLDRAFGNKRALEKFGETCVYLQLWIQGETLLGHITPLFTLQIEHFKNKITTELEHFKNKITTELLNQSSRLFFTAIATDWKTNTLFLTFSFCSVGS